MYKDRIELYKELEKKRGSRILTYFTGDRQGMETKIHSEVINYFVHHLDLFEDTPKISLFLYSRGGDTLAGWNIVNLIKQFCRDFEVIIPFKAHSTATLISIGASKIVMTKQATLSPIDPSVNTPLNPQLPGGPVNQRVPLSVEAIAGYFDLAKNMAKVSEGVDLVQIMLKLSDNIHPVALGNVYRARTQIQKLAEKLLKNNIAEKGKIKNIINFLCSESGSHDYTINRKEAKDDLSLPIEKPTKEEYKLIKSIYDDISNELKLDEKFQPEIELGEDSSKRLANSRAIIESKSGGIHKFVTEGTLIKNKINTPQGIVEIPVFQVNNEGWRHENVE